MHDTQGGLWWLVYLPFFHPPPNYPVPVGKNEEIKHRMIIECRGIFSPRFFFLTTSTPWRIARMRTATLFYKYSPEVHISPYHSIVESPMIPGQMTILTKPEGFGHFVRGILRDSPYFSPPFQGIPSSSSEFRSRWNHRMMNLCTNVTTP